MTEKLSQSKPGKSFRPNLNEALEFSLAFSPLEVEREFWRAWRPLRGCIDKLLLRSADSRVRANSGLGCRTRGQAVRAPNRQRVDALAMRGSHWLIWLFLFWFGTGALQAEFLIQRQFKNLNLTIPDNDASGVANVQTITGSPGGSVILEVKVGLKLSGSGARNGDLYVALDHQSGFAILLNRVGRREEDPFGYEDPGLDVTLEDGAPQGDIHVYRSTLFGNHDTPLGQFLASSWSGNWAPDGRNIDPDEVIESSPRQAGLGSFKGLPVDGRWRLFLADLAQGGISQLNDWSLEIRATTNLNALTLEYENATIRSDGDGRTFTIPILVKGALTIAGGANTALSGTISGPGHLIKNGAGGMVLSGANTFSGGIQLAEGALVLGDNRSAGLGRITLQGGAVRAGGGPLVLDNAVTLAGNLRFDGSEWLEFAGLATLQGQNRLTVENDTRFSGDLNESAPGAGFIKSGHGTLTLSGVNTFSGGIALEEGALLLGNDRALGTGTLTLKGGTLFSPEPREIFNAVQISGAVGISGGVTFTGDVTLDQWVRLDINGGARISGTLQESSPGAGLVKMGAGTLFLEGANTISGGVTLEEGILMVNNLSGSGTGTGSVNAGGSAVLGGTGLIAGPVTLGTGGWIAPGASPGTFTTGDQTWEAGAGFIWEINDADGAEGADPGWDLLAINGSLRLNGSVSNPFVMRLISLSSGNSPGAANHFNYSRDYAWRIARTTGGISGFAPGAIHIDASQFAPDVGGGAFQLEVRGNDLFLVYAAAQAPRVTRVERIGTQVRISILGRPLQNYRIEASHSLAPADWVGMGAVVADGTGSAAFLAPIEPDQPQRFYRILEVIP
jgi:autotransporter-associated beta strand protein